MSLQIHDLQFEKYLTDSTLQARVEVIAQQINRDYADTTPPILLGVLNGCVRFMADLLRHIDIACEVSLIKVASYEGTQSSGELTQILGLVEDIHHRHVILIEDIIDTGLTMEQLFGQLRARKPASLQIATLFWKREKSMHRLQPQYVGFEIPDLFVLGYGLDYKGLGRELNDIYVLKNE
ncbi:hypoxanthine phosphoribosyltransferase [Eisenibacter elegans]|jgi:hypoxanthine phosphoribosyltransferase|uniref:hypoxanthine phosphoribosyltransferase n=1 Tax=Eisenibacter elegans TaxID=997 RepID=UPI00041EA72F|nr:hypoxanthine phosphoribosyltransferase [Eisenibacter elegans]